MDKKYRKPKIKSFNPTWSCEFCDYISASKKGIELHLKMSHYVKDYKIKNPSKEKLKKLKNNMEEGFCVLCGKNMSSHSKNNKNCP